MKLFLALSLFGIFALTPSPSPGSSQPVKIIVEGVADSPEATRLAALAAIRERVERINYTLLVGKYPAYSLNPLPISLDTRGKRFLDTIKLPSGFYKTRMEITIPALDIAHQKDLPKVTGKGEAKIAEFGGIIKTRTKAIEMAMGEAIINAVNANYPSTSIPFRLTGTIYLLGTLKEDITDGKYLVEISAMVSLSRD